ncbi:MAG TPA: sensory rhodopsin transducer [Chryseosolibacter sp.]|nr:sensory rhodopsin transducer [Chryseosolibacter sp.]
MIPTRNFGSKVWAFAAGHIPLSSTGPEPGFTSHDKVSILNVTDQDASVRIEVFYEDKAPVGFREVVVKSRRVRKIRFNDLIDPFPVPLNVPFGFLIESDVAVIVQFSRMNTTQKPMATFCVTPYSRKNNS